MAKKILLFLVFFAFLACVYTYLTTPQAPPNYLSSADQISTTPTQEKQHEVFGVIKAINDRNEKITSLYVPSINMKIKQKMTVNTTGSMYFQKEKRYRMTVKSVFGQEMDVGSNDTHFWFWSKRMDPPDLFYARHEDLDKAMLKTPLNPSWLIESLTLGKIDTKNIEVGQLKGNWVVLQKRKAARGEDVTVATLISKEQNPRILGNYLYNSQGKMIASTEVSNYFDMNGLLVPKTMFITWYEEGLTMEWSLGQPQINVQIPESVWQIPNYPRKVEIK
jgi:hypothetical protein